MHMSTSTMPTFIPKNKQHQLNTYWGITITEKLQWTEHISNIIKRLVPHWDFYIKI